MRRRVRSLLVCPAMALATVALVTGAAVPAGAATRPFPPAPFWGGTTKAVPVTCTFANRTVTFQTHGARHGEVHR